MTSYEEGFFQITNNIIKDYLYEKTKVLNNQDYEILYALDDITIEGDPHTVFYLQDNSQENYQRFILNDTGLLDLGETDYFYTGLFAAGTHLLKRPEDRELTNDLEYVDKTLIARPGEEGEFFIDIHDIEANENVEKNAVYRVQSLKDVYISNEPILSNVGNSYLTELYNWIQPKNEAYEVIYYNNNWYLFTANHDVIHPVALTIYYDGEVEKGVYLK